MPTRRRVKAVSFQYDVFFRWCRLNTAPCKQTVSSIIPEAKRRYVKTMSCQSRCRDKAMPCQNGVVATRCRAKATPCSRGVVSKRCRANTAPCQDRFVTKQRRIKMSSPQHGVVSKRCRANKLPFQSDAVSRRRRAQQKSCQTMPHHDDAVSQ